MNAMRKAFKKYKSLSVQVRASLWFVICSFLQKGVSVITTPIFTRLLSTSEYGQYNVFDSWLKIVTIFVSLQIYLGVYTQGLVKFSDDRDRFASTLQGLTFVLTLAWTAIYLLFQQFWNARFKLTTVQMLAMLVMIWATSAYNLWAGKERVEYRYRGLVISTLVISIAKPLIGIVFVKHATDKVTARILGLTLVEFIGYSGFFIVQLRQGKQFYSRKYWKYVLWFNIPLIPHYLSQQVLNSADRIMIENMVGAGEAGIYSLAYSVSQVMTLFNTALSHTLSPWVFQKIKEKKADEISKIVYLALGVIAFVNLALIAIAPEAVAFFAPKEYYDAIWVIPPVAMSVLLMFSYDMYAKFAFYYEKTIYIMVASIVGAILNIILNFIFIRIFGYYAAGYTTLFCYIVYVIAHYLFMERICNKYLGGVKVYNSKLLLTFYLVFFAVGFGIMATYNHIIIRYGIIFVSLIAIIVLRKRFMKIGNTLLSIRK